MVPKTLVSLEYGRYMVKSGGAKFVGWARHGVNSYALLRSGSPKDLLWVLIGSGRVPSAGVSAAAADFVRSFEEPASCLSK